MKCVECGAEVTEVVRVCGVCGAPPVGARAVPVDLAPDGPGDGHARDVVLSGGSQPAWLRRGQPYYLVSLVFFVAVYMICWFAFERTQGSPLHHPVEWGIDLGVGGALLSAALFEAARGRFRARQLGWALVPLLSLGLLAFAPFLWLALIRRRTREWAVAAAYLAAEVTMIIISFVGNDGAGNATLALAGLLYMAGLLLIAPIHAVLAFNPARGPSSRREARAARETGWA